MVGQARQNYPHLKFVLQDAAAMNFRQEFDAVFSNAALHWMLNASEVAGAIARALRPGGRFVAELGGHGNIAQIMRAIEEILPKYYSIGIPAGRTYFPSIAEYANILEAQGLEVRVAQLFDRPTPLEGEQGMENWLRQFKWFYFEGLESSQQERALQEVVEKTKPPLHAEKGWFADYRRVRIMAVKVGAPETWELPNG